METINGAQSPLADVKPGEQLGAATPGTVGYSSNTPWQDTYEYGTVYYCAAGKSEVAVVLDQHLLGVEITPGIVRTRLDGGGWSSGAMLAGALYFVAADTYLHVRKEQPIDYILATVSPERIQQVWDEVVRRLGDAFARASGFAGSCHPDRVIG
jgi:hypothetical protein